MRSASGRPILLWYMGFLLIMLMFHLLGLQTAVTFSLNVFEVIAYGVFILLTGF